MADAQSRYVKLTKDQVPLEDIKPGELNQPIDVPQVQYFLFLRFDCFIYRKIWYALSDSTVLEKLVALNSKLLYNVTFFIISSNG